MITPIRLPNRLYKEDSPKRHSAPCRMASLWVRNWTENYISTTLIEHTSALPGDESWTRSRSCYCSLQCVGRHIFTPLVNSTETAETSRSSISLTTVIEHPSQCNKQFVKMTKSFLQCTLIEHTRPLIRQPLFSPGLCWYRATIISNSSLSKCTRCVDLLAQYSRLTWIPILNTALHTHFVMYYVNNTTILWLGCRNGIPIHLL